MRSLRIVFWCLVLSGLVVSNLFLGCALLSMDVLLPKNYRRSEFVLLNFLRLTVAWC